MKRTGGTGAGRKSAPAPIRAVIPAGGFGTRMLPATKSMPKEMMPVLGKPTIQYVVEEAVASGIDEVVIVTGRSKRAVEDHFDGVPELSGFLRVKGKPEMLDLLTTIPAHARLFYVRQESPLGLGHAVLQAAPLVKEGASAVLLGDDIIVSERPVVRQLRDVHEQTGASVVSVQRVPKEEVSKYGIVETEDLGDGLHRIVDMVEKPSLDEAPSDLAIMGRYVFTPGILPHLARTKPGRGGEIQLTDAMRTLLKDEEIYCIEPEGRRFDVGNLAGWLEANVLMALGRKDLAPVVHHALSEAQAAASTAGGAKPQGRRQSR